MASWLTCSREVELAVGLGVRGSVACHGGARRAGGRRVGCWNPFPPPSRTRRMGGAQPPPTRIGLPPRGCQHPTRRPPRPPRGVGATL